MWRVRRSFLPMAWYNWSCSESLETEMRSKITEQGVALPKQWFPGAAEVEIQREQDRVVVVPVREEDSITELGKNPINVEMDDAAANHDRYLYDQ